MLFNNYDSKLVNIKCNINTRINFCDNNCSHTLLTFLTVCHYIIRNEKSICNFTKLCEQFSTDKFNSL